MKKILLFLFIFVSPVLASEKILINPVDNISQNYIHNEKNNDYTKYGYIKFNSSLVSEIKVGDLIKIDVPEKISYEIFIESIKVNSDGSNSFFGRIKDHKFSTVVINVDKENFIFSLNDLIRNYEYIGYGNISDGSGVIKHININKMPAIIHLPPVNK